ncbi:MAG: TIGR01841 family phasin [Limnobacter sp.]|nr:TIGR01841 family phasin [Limnobacter sp.]
MFINPEQLIEAQKKQLKLLLSLGQKSFLKFEETVELNMNTAKNSLDETGEALNSLTSVKDVQELMTLIGSLGQPVADRAMAYNQELYKLLSGIATEASATFEAQVSESNKKLVEMVETATKNAPAGSESAVAFIKSALSAANSAYDSASKAAKQAVEMAETNLTSATQAASKATKSVAKKQPP